MANHLTHTHTHTHRVLALWLGLQFPRVVINLLIANHLHTSPTAPSVNGSSDSSMCVQTTSGNHQYREDSQS